MYSPTPIPSSMMHIAARNQMTLVWTPDRGQGDRFLDIKCVSLKEKSFVFVARRASLDSRRKAQNGAAIRPPRYENAARQLALGDWQD